ncbi:MAG: zf-HC2 domain-containing protein [Polyangiales bacterium]
MSAAGSDELSHEQARELLDAWREGELEAAEAERVKAHVESCDRCRAVEAALGGGLKALLALEPKPESAKTAAATPDLLPAVQRKIRLRSRGRWYGDARAKESSTPSPWPLLVVSLALLAALAIAYVMLGSVGGASTGAPSTSSSR